MKLLINVNYIDEKKNFWQESFLKNTVITVEEGETIHAAITRVCEESDGIKMSYRGKPQSEMYRGKNPKIVGYVYRCKSEIYDGSMPRPQTALFDVWVEISEVKEMELPQIN